jgi:hypothetical protein
MDADGRDY